MKPPQLLDTLREFRRERLAMRQRHVANARAVGDYDFNNTYQYIIAREDVQLEWLDAAIRQVAGDMGVTLGDLETIPEPAADGTGGEPAVIARDREAARAFVDRWRDRVEAVTQARHRIMLRVVLGETLEHERFFKQAEAGRRDLLGRRADGAGTTGRVLSERWIE